MKTLREEGVPFGARVVFRIQLIPAFTMALAGMCLIPFLGLLGAVNSEMVSQFVDGVEDWADRTKQKLTAKRDKVIRMYRQDL